MSDLFSQIPDAERLLTTTRRSFLRNAGLLAGFSAIAPSMVSLRAEEAGKPLPVKWRNLGAGGGGWLPCMAVCPTDSSIVYAGCDVGGFFKSTDRGQSWRICNIGLRSYYVEVITPHPYDAKVIYIGTEGGVHKSVDGGESWTWLGNGFPARQSGKFSAPIGALALDPKNPQLVYAGIGHPRFGKNGCGTVYYSADGGQQWKIANPNGGGMSAEALISDLATHPRNTQRLYAATDAGLYRSEDGAQTWHRLANGLPHERVRRVIISPSQPETLYVALRSQPGKVPWQGGVYRSDDGGETWATRADGLGHRVGQPGQPAQMTSNVDRIAVHPANPDIVYAGDSAWVTAGVYLSENGGKNWKLLTHSKDPKSMDYGWLTMAGPSVTGLALDAKAPDTVYFSTSMQVFRTDNRGGYWEQCYTKKAGESADGPHWSTTGQETTCLRDVVVHPKDSSQLYFCYQDIGLIHSRDSGKSFAPSTQGMKNRGNVFTVAIDPAEPRIVYAGTGWWAKNSGDVCRSEDGGATWKVVGMPATGLPDAQTHRLVIDPSSPVAARRVFVTLYKKGIFCSEDGGASWQSRQNGLPHGNICDLRQHPQKPEVLFAVLGEEGKHLGGVYRSADRGQSWQPCSSSFVCPDPKLLVIAPSEPSRMYLATRRRYASDRKVYPGGVYVSRDSGATWQSILDNHFIAALTVDPRDADVLYAGGTDHPYHDDAIGMGIMQTKDGGRHWVSLNSESLSSRNVSCLTLDPHHPGRIYAGTSGNGVFVTEV